MISRLLGAISMTEYSVFTRKYDETISAADLLARATKEQVSKRAGYVPEHGSPLARPDSIHQAKERAVGIDLDADRVVLLLDQSGSSRGKDGVYAARALDVAAAVLEAKGIPFAVLGFTTSRWKGGRSREDWIVELKRQRSLSDGSEPWFPSPGRLNDRLHVVYKGFDAMWGGNDDGDPSPRALLDLVYNDPNMRENLDGEAVEAALEMLAGAERPSILMFAEAYPVDASTLSCNPADFLQNHFIQALEAARAAGATTALVRNDVADEPFLAACTAGFDAVSAKPGHLDDAEPVLDALRRLGQARHHRLVPFRFEGGDGRREISIPDTELASLGAVAALSGRADTARHPLHGWSYESDGQRIALAPRPAPEADEEAHSTSADADHSDVDQDSPRCP